MNTVDRMLLKQEMFGHVEVAHAGSVEISLTFGSGALLVQAIDYDPERHRGIDADPLVKFSGRYEIDNLRQAVRRFHDMAERFGAEVA
jgi:hypothetical protein